MEISKEDAELILEADSVCEGEGIGPNMSGLILRIADKWPDLVTQYRIDRALRE